VRALLSAYAVSNTSDDFSEPETPVTTVSRLCGIASEQTRAADELVIALRAYLK
jgi:hypothetical protein